MLDALQHEKGKIMKKRVTNISDELRDEYSFDYSQAVRGKYHQQLLEEGSNIIVLDPDLAAIFPDSAIVNRALRLLLTFTKSAQELTGTGSHL